MNRKRRVKDLVLTILIWTFSLIGAVFLIWMLISVISKGLPGINPEFLTSEYNLYKGSTGILPMIVGTLVLIFSTLVIAVPIGICAAIYLTEYAKQGLLVRAIRITTESLSGIPSIIYGLFGFIFFKNKLGLGFSVLSGALTLSIMVLPLVVRTTEEALKSVDPGYREASLALGAPRLYTICRVVLPCAIPGILTAVILSMGRVIGETAAVVFTAGSVPKIPRLGRFLTSSIRTLSVHLYVAALEEGDFTGAYATAAILMLIIAVLNFIAKRIARRL
ncbi:MAG: phosphate ABC transporter permease PstA [Clostridiaceae bacterium]|jgi:phosphate transport system permease protein|nr:phosphate ABC transporter permease PstA [Bacillota bacterium]NLI38608.1 phosphate ABC transporter permease PstA [Clostridiaceae bacterium]